MPSGASGPKAQMKLNKRSFERQHRNLLNKAKIMGLDPDIRELADNINDLRQQVEDKNFELDMLEIIAMESHDENVVSLREELFTTVKLVHNDVIQETLNEQKARAPFIQDYYDSERNDIIEDDMTGQSIWAKIMDKWSERRQRKEYLKAVRKKLKARKK